MVKHTYSEHNFPSTSKPDVIQTYRWIPEAPRGAVFLLHGFRAHARFNFLRSDTPTSLHNYGDANHSSLIRELNARRLAVFAHDHVGHGRSSGLRAYFPSFQTLVDDTVAHVHVAEEEFGFAQAGLPVFLIGHSMGATVAILAAREHSHLFSGVALCSAATEPPANMFGFIGRIQYALSGITSYLIPKQQLLALPKSPDLHMQALFDSDPLNCTQLIRARVGREFLNAYQDISHRLPQITFPFLAAFGENDTLVNPTAAKNFHDGSTSDDKTLFQADGRWHNLFVETGREEVWNIFADWVAGRLPP